MSSTKKPSSITNIQDKLNNSAVDKPPEHFTEDLKDIWNDIKTKCEDGVFIKSDYFILVMLCHLIKQFDDDPVHFSDGKHECMLNCLIQCGLTPKSRKDIVIEK